MNIKKEFMKSIKDNWIYYLMIIPAVVLTFIFAYRPMYGIILAFKDFDFRLGIKGSPWVGLANFNTIFAVEQFWIALKNTLVINILKLLFGFPAPIILAVMLNAVGRKSVRGPIQTVLYLPHFISWVVVSGIIFSLLESNGIFYSFLNLIGINNYDVLVDGNGALLLVILSDIWKEVGWGSIIYLAAISGINPEMYEASEIDGANKIQQFFYITIPSIAPTIGIMFILQVGSLVGGNFDQIYNLYNELIYNKIDVIDTFLYRYGISNGRFSEGTAIGLFINLMNAILLLTANKITKKFTGEGMY